VQDTVKRALAPFEENRNARFQVSGEDVMLDANQALLLAMATHELATNAAKYGALSNTEGRIELDWAIKPAAKGQKLCVTWRESGGPEVRPPTRKGFGSTLIERALQQEQGRSCFEYRPAGVVCTLEVKL
jgi:two-component sensor histidine kinase